VYGEFAPGGVPGDDATFSGAPSREEDPPASAAFQPGHSRGEGGCPRRSVLC